MVEVVQPPIGEPNRVERWDPAQRMLLVETAEQLKPGLKEVGIQMTQGRIVVEGSDETNPHLVTRLYVSASTEEEAKKYVGEKKGEFEVRKGQGSLSVDARSQEGVAFGGGSVVIGGGRSVVIGGDLVGGTVIGGGEVWINGQRVDLSRGGAQVVPSTQREVVLKVPMADQLRYNLETQAGAIEVKRTGGECRVTTSAAGVQISEFEGEDNLNNRSGDVEIEKFRGELSLNATSGDVEIEEFDGVINLVATSGDVKLGRATVKGRANNIRATSGDIRVGVANDSLAVTAETMSGKIRTPQGSEFVIVREDRPKKEGGAFGRGTVVIASGASVVSIGGSGGRSMVEGRFGQIEKPENRLNLNATSGDITIAKS